MNKTAREELRALHEEAVEGIVGTHPPFAEFKCIEAIPELLDALDEAEQTIQTLRELAQTLRELAPQPAPRDSEGKWQ